MEPPSAYGLGSGREGVLVELFVMKETDRLVGVFSTRAKADAYAKTMPTVVELVSNPDGYGTQERPAKYTIRRVVLDRVETDA